jgi:ornithine carrier protein
VLLDSGADSSEHCCARLEAERRGLAVTRRSRSYSGNAHNPLLPIWQSMLAGAGAGLGYNFSFFPADTIKSKMQTGDLASIGATGGRQTFMEVGRALYRTHGLKGLYRGCGITLLRSAPSSALIFTIYETLRTQFG